MRPTRPSGDGARDESVAKITAITQRGVVRTAQLTLFRRWLGGSVVAADADHGGPSPQRLGLLLAIFMAFIGGGVLGTLAFGWLPKLTAM